VEFVFSDKTGTLTQNKMEFKKCTVNNIVYGTPISAEDETLGLSTSARECLKDMIMQKGSNQDSELIRGFFEHLAVCHTVVVDHDPDTNEKKLQAASPDELALVQGAEMVGMELIGRKAK